MNKKRILLVLAGFFVMLMVAAGVLYAWLGQWARPEISISPKPITQQADSTKPAQDTVSAPDFTVYDAEGNPVKLSDFFGKPIVLNFWASWCGPCRMEMPHFEKAYQEMGEDIQFVMVNMTIDRETQQSAQDFLDETGYTFPVLFDTTGDAAIAYGTYSLPMSVFIDANGNVQDLAIGAIDEATLLSKIDKIK